MKALVRRKFLRYIYFLTAVELEEGWQNIWVSFSCQS